MALKRSLLNEYWDQGFGETFEPTMAKTRTLQLLFSQRKRIFFSLCKKGVQCCLLQFRIFVAICYTVSFFIIRNLIQFHEYFDFGWTLNTPSVTFTVHRFIQYLGLKWQWLWVAGKAQDEALTGWETCSIGQQNKVWLKVLKSGGPYTLAAHRGKKVGGPGM